MTSSRKGNARNRKKRLYLFVSPFDYTIPSLGYSVLNSATFLNLYKSRPFIPFCKTCFNLADKLIRNRAKNEQCISNDLETSLKESGLYCKEILGDGNCLFRALSDQYYGDTSKHGQIRHNVCMFILANKQDFEPFIDSDFESYVKNMRKDGVFGGNMELVAFSRHYGADIKVYQAGGTVFAIDCENGNSNTVHIA
ncbi:OTU domain-containing protein 3 [Smittium culicis]|uniref:OTU domain-containing protein 3 n=1 Tax=Smittium culicis TaxID=133412 RepID=A0A1R1YJA1_9FUNG|nr:OTU domain-containing protein 3 [Smittium culicis]